MRRIWLALALCMLAAAPAHAAETKYSLAGGCFEVAGAPIRFQATTLAEYLLYTKDGEYIAAGGEPAGAPSPSTEWGAAEGGGGVDLTPKEGDGSLTVGPGTTGCAVFPEIEVNATGTPAGSKPYQHVRGLVDGHMHWMAFEFLGGSAHCGRPWHKYGVEYALVDCPDHSAGGGCSAVLENVLYGNPARCHDPGGWPTFTGWPDPQSLTHENSYYKWVERAWLGGLRIFVNLLVENKSLCDLYPLKRNGCNEMDSVRLQYRDLNALQDYVDAQYGGPGKGWLRLVDDPFEARRVINQGKLAVVQGIEVSQLFDCNIYNGVPQCSKEMIDESIDELYGMGVRQMELINKFDNALAGVAGDGGETGVVVNSGNKKETNRYWDMRTCSVGEGDKEQPALPRDVLVGNGLAALLPPGTAPVYPEPPHCNFYGLSDLGEYVVRELMKRGIMIDPDHLSQAARDEVLAIVEAARYPGIMSSHSWSNDQDYPRILAQGGVVTPYAGSTENFVKQWEKVRQGYNSRYYNGFGYGADMNGFGSQGLARNPEDNPVQYPFKSFDGSVTLGQQKSGERRLRHQHGRHGPLRPVSRLGRGPAHDRRRPDRRGDGARGRGLPADVGALRGHPPRVQVRRGRRTLHQDFAQEGAARPDRAAAPQGPRQAAAHARARVEVLRARATHTPEGTRHRRLQQARTRGDDRHRRPQPPRQGRPGARQEGRKEDSGEARGQAEPVRLRRPRRPRPLRGARFEADRERWAQAAPLSAPRRAEMRQLTSLDAQFLALETPRQTGHVGGVAILDPATAPGGVFDYTDVKRLLEERLPLLPPFRWRLAEVPFGSTTRTGWTTRTSTSTSMSASSRSPGPAPISSSPSRLRASSRARSTAPARCGSCT